jgi:hypothetical protein
VETQDIEEHYENLVQNPTSKNHPTVVFANMLHITQGFEVMHQTSCEKNPPSFGLIDIRLCDSMVQFDHATSLFVFSPVQIARTLGIPTVSKSPTRKSMESISFCTKISPTKHSNGRIQSITHKMNPTMLRPQQNHQAYPCPFAPQKPPEHLPHLQAHQQHLAAALVFEAQVPGFQTVAAESEVVEFVALVRA